MSLGKHKQEQQDFVRKALTTLDMLDERAEKIDMQMGQIETRMRELEEEEEADKVEETEREEKRRG